MALPRKRAPGAAQREAEARARARRERAEEAPDGAARATPAATADRRDARRRRAAPKRTSAEPGPGADHHDEDARHAKRQDRQEKRERKQAARSARQAAADEARAARRFERSLRGPGFWTLFEPIPRHPRRVPKGQAILILILNTVPFPGLGTVLYGKWERGLAQFLLTFLFLIGWVWAITDGIIIVKNAFQAAPRGGHDALPRTPRADRDARGP